MQVFINNHPLSPRVPEATTIIDECRAKLELKDYKSADLYYNLGIIAQRDCIRRTDQQLPSTAKGDEYKLMVIKSSIFTPETA